MADAAHEWTDGQIDELRERLRRTYASAEREMRERLAWFMRSYDMQNERWKKQVASGQATEEEYRNWRRNMATDRAFLSGMVSKLADDAVNVDRMAIGMVNDSLPQVYSENANMAAYEVEMGIGKNTHSFDLVDESTIRVLMQDPDLLPEVRQPRFDNGVDLRWNRQKLTGAITQSILQGESIPRAADRLSRVMRMSESSAVRAARTAITSAENAGRISSYKRAESIGIKLEQQWLATLDSRTRHSHRLLDGQHVPVGEKFKVDGEELEYPGDPNAPGEYVYNCRCTLVAWFPDIEQEDPERWSDLPPGMTYDEWKSEKKEGQDQESFVVVNGRDILGTWSRRESEFEFEIDDVLNAQGFDGKPRVVSADEFDEAVRAANDGNGFVAQRSYSAPDQETLDAYRQMLYGGKWYVDCSAGGAQYGQGMYCASDWTGTITADMRSEMRHYTTLNQGRLGAQPLSDEGKEEFLRRWVDANVDEAYRDAALTYLMFESRVGDVEWADVGRAVETLGEDRRVRLLEYGVHQDAFSMLDGYSYVETMTLDPSARVISYDELRAEYARAGMDVQRARDRAVSRADYRYYDLGEISREEYDRLISSQPTMPSDMGSYAASRGYDAINAEGHGASGSYTVILNRTKLIIREPE